MLRSVSLTCMAAALTAASGIANAGLVSIGGAEVQFARPIFGDSGYDRVYLHYPNRDGNPRVMRTNAGRFSGSASSDDFDADIFYENADTVYLYCVDLYESVGSGWGVGYDVNILTPDSPNVLIDDGHPVRDFDRTLTFLGALNYTLATDYAYLGFVDDPYNWLNPATSWMSGAIQLGIWESLYESVGGNLTAWDILGGDFRVSDVGRGGNRIDSNGAELLSRTFANIGQVGVDPLGTQFALVLTSESAQDMIAGDPPLGVPAPASALLLLTGVGLLRRRRR